MDNFEGAYEGSLRGPARAAMRDVLAVKRDERMLIVSNPEKEVRLLSLALFDAALEAKAAPTLVFQRTKGQFDFAEEEVIKAIASGPDIVLSMSADRLGKDKFGMRVGYKGKRRYDHVFDTLYEEGKMRSFWSPGITRDMFVRTVPIDYARLRNDCARVIRAMTGAHSVRVTAPGGTDVVVGVRGRKAKADDGDFRKAGQGGNLPSGEVYVSPQLGAMCGTIAFDGSIVLHEGEVVIKRPILAEVSDGFVTSISGGREALKLEESVRLGERKAFEAGRKGDLRRDLVKTYARNARSVGELGIGLNRRAKIVARTLEDEKVYGTCHFAIGSNYDGDADSLIHLDGLVKRPTITVIKLSGAERELMVDGRLIWD